MNENFNRYRKQIQYVLNGPREIKGVIGGDHFYGWPYFLLAVRAPVLDWQETRIIYANIYDKFQKYGVIRSTLWNGTNARQLFRQDPLSYSPSIPARFVVVPIDKIKLYMEPFRKVSAPVLSKDIEPQIEIRRIRIERDYITGVFERTWHLGSVSKSLRALDKAWSIVWNYLVKDLNNADEIEKLEEDFWIDSFQPNYDIEGYNNKLFYEEWTKFHNIEQ